MAKRTQLTYNALERNIPHLLNLQLKDKFRYNRQKFFYTVVDVYQSWAVGIRRHSKGYSIVVISQHDFTALDLEEYDLHIVFSEAFKFKGALLDAYNLLKQEIRKGIDGLNRGFVYESKNCVYGLTIEKEVMNEEQKG